LSKSRKAIRLHRHILALYTGIAFSVVVLTADAIIMGIRLLSGGETQDIWLWLEAAALTVLCVYAFDTLRKYKMREYANELLGVDNMKLTDTLKNCAECNSIPRYVISVGSFLRRVPPTVEIVCTSCGRYGDQYHLASQAIWHWNAGNAHDANNVGG